MSPTREVAGLCLMPMSIASAQCVKFIEQPSQEFRFRYLSEFKKGSHGCLKSDHKKKRKEGGGPVIRVNYVGQVLLEVCLFTVNEPRREHVHKLVEGSKTENANTKLMFNVTEKGSNSTGSMDIELKNMNILHMGKDEVDRYLKDWWLEENHKSPAEFDSLSSREKKQIEEKLKEQKRDIENNVVLGVRVFVGEKLYGDICYSNKISNTKTNKKLNIEDISKVSGSCSGGDEVYIFCDKLRLDDIDKSDPEKSDVGVEFYETTGDSQWSAIAKIKKIHHQAAMIFETPPYKTMDLKHDLEVYMRLVRRSDRETSDPRRFIYEPLHDDYALRRKRLKTFHGAEGNKGQGVKGRNNNGGKSKQDAATKQDAELLLSLSRGGTPNVSDSEVDVELPGVELLEKLVRGDMFEELKYFLENYDDQSELPNLGGDLDLELPNDAAGDAQSVPLAQQEEAFAVQQNEAFGVQQNEAIAVQQNEAFVVHQNEALQINKVFVVQQDEAFGVQQSEALVHQSGAFSVQQNETIDVSPMLSGRSRDINDFEIDSDRKTSTSIEERLAEIHLSDDIGLEKNASEPNANMLPNENEPSSEKKSLIYSSGLILAYKLSLQTAHCLHSYARTGNVNILLMSMRHLIALQDEHGDNALHASVLNSQPHALKNLLEVARTIAEYDVLNMCNEFNQSPLHVAVQMKQGKMVNLLLYYGANPNRVDKNGNMAIHLAAQQDSDCCLKEILNTVDYTTKYKKHVPNLNAHNYAGYTPLHLAVLKNSFENVNRLCYAGCDVNAKDYTSGRSALHMAVENQNIDILMCLLQNFQAETDSCMFNGNTPLHVAVMQDNLPIVSLLMEAQADPYLENYQVEILEDENETKDGCIETDISSEFEFRGNSAWNLARSPKVRACLKREPCTTAVSDHLKTLKEFTSCDLLDSGIGLSTTSISYDEDQNALEDSKRTLSDIFDRCTIEQLARSLDQNELWEKVLQSMNKSNLILICKDESSPTSALLKLIYVNESETFAHSLNELKLLDAKHFFTSACKTTQIST